MNCRITVHFVVLSPHTHTRTRTRATQAPPCVRARVCGGCCCCLCKNGPFITNMLYIYYVCLKYYYVMLYGYHLVFSCSSASGKLTKCTWHTAVSKNALISISVPIACVKNYMVHPEFFARKEMSADTKIANGFMHAHVAMVRCVALN
jgi:hypothetical protein